jgi:hypothetical protein
MTLIDDPARHCSSPKANGPFGDYGSAPPDRHPISRNVIDVSA